MTPFLIPRFTADLPFRVTRLDVSDAPPLAVADPRTKTEQTIRFFACSTIKQNALSGLTRTGSSPFGRHASARERRRRSGIVTVPRQGIRHAQTADSRPANPSIRMAEALPPAHASTLITTAHVFRAHYGGKQPGQRCENWGWVIEVKLLAGSLFLAAGHGAHATSGG